MTDTVMIYKDTSVVLFEEGLEGSVTLPCANKVVVGDIKIQLGTDCSITYGDKVVKARSGQVAKILCLGKVMQYDIVVSTNHLQHPSVELQGTTLTLLDASGRADEFVILVDGEEVAVVEVS